MTGVQTCALPIYTAGQDKRYRPNYAIRYLQNVEPGKPYFILRNPEDPDVPENRMVFGALYNNIRHFVINFTEQNDQGGLMALKPAMLERLDKIPRAGFWNIGFSLDESDIVHFHVSPAVFGRFGLGGLDGERKETVIPLDNYVGMFELTEVKEVSGE